LSRRAPVPLISDDTSVTLDDRWRELFGSEPTHKKGEFLRHAIAWKEQVLAHGDVSRAVQRDLKIAAADALGLRAAPVDKGARRGVTTSTESGASNAQRATTLPPASSQLVPGTRLVKAYQGVNHIVEATDEGFLYAGHTYASLSAIAKVITGTHWNGLLFFGLRKRKIYPKKIVNG
jgi:hypothetical protein